MPESLEAVAGSPWVLVLVLVVSGLDAVLPFMPSESTVVATGVMAAATGRPHLAALIAAAAAGAYAGDWCAYAIGRRSTAAVTTRLGRRRRSQQLHEWARRLLHSRGGLVIVFARYVPGGRSTTAFAAGVVGYPVARFRWYTALAVSLWACEAALLGYLGGSVFAGQPLLGLLLGGAGAFVVTGFAVAVERWRTRRDDRVPLSGATHRQDERARVGIDHQERADTRETCELRVEED
ncbi:DedA family protein [Winogradskya humida]|uniref:VTT domain-containing protein n=1 Tax=Winogradskya humida TaxID=113566 RepID=A0ABQ3ZHX5_9ACTN|nr:DedA family protein [Actinoplanes humidus]GIE18119.1 hypothetical protein Ahu01nite_012210 [Actinoplanes humidus]